MNFTFGVDKSKGYASYHNCIRDLNFIKIRQDFIAKCFRSNSLLEINILLSVFVFFVCVLYNILYAVTEERSEMDKKI